MAVIFPLYFAVILAGIFANTIAIDNYCSVETCEIKGPHTMCTYTVSRLHVLYVYVYIIFNKLKRT